MNLTVAPSFLDIETAYRRERITRDWGRPGRHHRAQAVRPKHRGSGHLVPGTARRAVAAAR